MIQTYNVTSNIVLCVRWWLRKRPWIRRADRPLHPCASKMSLAFGALIKEYAWHSIPEGSVHSAAGYHWSGPLKPIPLLLIDMVHIPHCQLDIPSSNNHHRHYIFSAWDWIYLFTIYSIIIINIFFIIYYYLLTIYSIIIIIIYNYFIMIINNCFYYYIILS